jgi:hypothetical protein
MHCRKDYFSGTSRLELLITVFMLDAGSSMATSLARHFKLTLLIYVIYCMYPIHIKYPAAQGTLKELKDDLNYVIEERIELLGIQNDIDAADVDETERPRGSDDEVCACVVASTYLSVSRIIVTSYRL